MEQTNVGEHSMEEQNRSLLLSFVLKQHIIKPKLISISPRGGLGNFFSPHHVKGIINKCYPHVGPAVRATI